MQNPRSPGTSRTVGPVGGSLSLRPLLAAGRPLPDASSCNWGPEQSHCVFTKEQLEPEHLGAAQLAKTAQASASPQASPGSPPAHTMLSLLQGHTAAGRLCPHIHAWVVPVCMEQRCVYTCI